MNNNKTNEFYGNTIKAIRLSKGLTMAQFANLLGVSKGTISLWEANKVTPQITQLKKIQELENTINTNPSHDLFFKLADMSNEDRFNYIQNEISTLVRLMPAKDKFKLFQFLIEGLPVELKLNLIIAVLKNMEPIELPQD
ncbi:helix-turn-helix domain-containing protein [Veillonella caviae]|uniref:helix-turn-helix domain-containing protein n=1 Tax=Veillonella caviae TaxID=248316 RepID=UPI0023A8EC91|nr:helix-turn-helix transcriptional regulator [Veillonella caviae]MCI5708966.1 helix-turn-helix transcriptional regulator [Veillonella caviae]MCI6407677.1 helix-turn-helix transcriptional regulator [Veillonella caviae]MDY5714957.1 helix-turn-helix transcriptional regulator [Veillonella caviae]MDY6225791.1 helix-turn-helix transcriptional regulator [Veillonella caviae]